MHLATSYEAQAVARAVDIPVRRLEGWVERRVVVPTRPARGTGRRAQFSRADVLRVAILAEVQRLLGIDFRPGGLGAHLGSDPLTWAQLDTVFRLATQDDEPGGRRTESRADARAALLLYVSLDGQGRPSLGVTRKTLDEVVQTTPVLLIVDPRRLWQKVRSRLDGHAT
jgi:hypothetical protein